MPQSLAKIAVHLVFSTKNRERILLDSFREDLHNVMGGLLNSMGCQSLIVGTADDHIHALFLLSRTITISDCVSKLKTGSNDWLRNHPNGPHIASFHWQGGYAAFSVSQSQIETVRDYIRNQREHHQTLTFQDELRSFFRKFEIVFDERYVWD
jgi:putative transposase